MRLGFHYHVPFYAGSGGISAPGYIGRFLDSIAIEVDQLTCFMHSADPLEIEYSDHIFQSLNVRWVDLGPKVSVPKRNLFARRYMRLLREHLDGLDALLIRGPSPLLPAMAQAAGTTPVALLLVGDYLAGVNDLPQPRWRKEAIRLWMHWNTRQQLRVARRSLTFVNSHLLYEQLRPVVPNLIETRTTTLSAADFFEREDTCQATPIRLLYTGRMDRAKGLFEIMEALDLLVQSGLDVVLDLVGWPAKGDTIVDELLNDAWKRGIRDRVFYHGFKAVGPELFAYYKQADIYVIASKSSFEGFPRTIWEAMAHSLPVVTTRVGSIPYYLSHGETAYFVEVASGHSVAKGIKTVIENPQIRTALLRNGRHLARQNTLEVRAIELVTALDAQIRNTPDRIVRKNPNNQYDIHKL